MHQTSEFSVNGRITMKFIRGILISCLILPRLAGAFTNPSDKVYRSDGTASDTQNAINAASDGWTVLIPAGSYTWSSGVLISGKGIHLKGSGASSVTISGSASPKISITKDSTHSVEVSGISFGTGGVQTIFITGSWSAKPFIVHDCVFNRDGGQAFRVECNGGLIYNCTVNGAFGFNDQGVQHKNPQDTQSWATDDTMGMKDTNGERNLYIEDCTFNSMPLQGLDVDDASRIVVRYCRFNNSAITSHGQDTSAVGMRHFEIYNNVFDYSFSHNDPSAKDVGYFIYIRGGIGIVADNTIDNITSQLWGDTAEVLLTVFNINRSGQIPCQTRYPAARQVGQGHNGSSVITDPLRIWGNTGGGNYNSPRLQQYTPDECENAQKVGDYIKVNRDYYLSARPNYAKYTYPHPLTLIGKDARNQPPVAVASATPTNGVAPLAVIFSSSGSFDPEGVALAYNWTFGDGATATAGNATHTYLTPGVYTARLSVSDGTNATSLSHVSIKVTASPP